MVAISPCDAIEARKAVIAASKTSSPTYVRLARNDTPVITTEQTPFVIGKAQVLCDASLTDTKIKLDATIIATGSLVYEALKAAAMLTKEGKNIAVLNLATIKPLDEETIIAYAHKSGAVVTVEEHQLAGGMGSAVGECLAGHYPVPMEFIAVKDEFGQSGTPSELIKHYGLDAKAIYTAVQRVVLRKK
jgi:transketolase